MITKIATLIRRHSREQKVKLSAAEKDLRRRRPDIRSQTEVNLGDCKTVEELITQEPEAKQATGCGYPVSQWHLDFIDAADELAAAECISWTSAAKRLILDAHRERTGKKLPPTMLDNPKNQRRRTGCSPVAFSEGNSPSAAAEQQLSDDAHELSKARSITLIEAIKVIRGQQL